MQYSDCAEKIIMSPIRKMMVTASKMPDAISFAVGEPDFVTADHILKAAADALPKSTKYAPGAGVDELRRDYAVYLSEKNHVNYEASEVIVTTGGMAALQLGMFAVINPGDEVLIPAPYFSNYSQEVILAGGVPVEINAQEENDFNIMPEQIREKLTVHTKLILLNSPCNPTGTILKEEVLAKIAEIVREKDLFVISDEVYRAILFDQQEYKSIIEFDGMKERTLIVDSCSKTFAMTGFRVGFAAGPRKWIELMTKMTEEVYSSVSTVGQYAAIEALKNGEADCERMRAEYEKRRDYIYDRICGIKELHTVRPQGAFYVFVNIKQTGLKAKEFCERLLQEKHVAVVPGDTFGHGNNDFVRISYATSMENIVEGMNRIEEFIMEMRNA